MNGRWCSVSSADLRERTEYCLVPWGEGVSKTSDNDNYTNIVLEDQHQNNSSDVRRSTPKTQEPSRITKVVIAVFFLQLL
jgi:hypothetical protein